MKSYCLQQLHVINYQQYWFDVYFSEDLDFIKSAKMIYSKKYQSTLFRIVEII